MSTHDGKENGLPVCRTAQILKSIVRLSYDKVSHG